MGNGDGTFAPVTNFATGSVPQGVAVADVNGDLNDDVIASNFAFSANSVSVLLGHGDGTFDPHTDFGVSFNPESVTVGDVNGDLVPDIVTPNESSNDVSVLLGNGDGTFGTKADYPVDLFPQQVAIADVNRDSNADLVSANIDGDSFSVLLNNGDGTFAPRIDFDTGAGSSPGFLTAGDLNGDLKPDVVTSNFGTNKLGIFLNTGLLDQIITFPTIAGHSFGDPDFALPASTSSALPLAFSSSTPTVCTVTGGTVHLVGAGTCTIQADQLGNPIFNPADPVAVSFPVAKATQTITFASIADHQLGDADFALPATTSSGLPVTFSSTTPTVCTVTGSTVHLVRVGICGIEVDQVGNANFEPAQMSRSFAVSQVLPATQESQVSAIGGSVASKPKTNPPSTPSAVPSPAPVAAQAPSGQSSAPTPAQVAAAAHAHHARAALPASLPTPGQLDVSPQSLLTSLAVALLLVLLLLFPAELLNNTIEEHYDEITAGLDRWRARLARTRQGLADLSGGTKALLMCAVGGFTCVFLDPQASLDPATIAFFIGMTGALALLVLVYQAPAKALLERSGHPGIFATFPAALLAGMVFVAVSRAASFQPGFAFGLIAGWAFATATPREEGRAIAFGGVVLLGVSLLAWFAWAALPVDMTGSSPSFLALVLDAFLASTFVAGIEGFVLAFVPIKLFDGAAVRTWSRSAHLALLLIGTFIFVHILVGGTSYIGKSNTVSAGAVAVTFAAFSSFSITFYCYWRWRTWRTERIDVPVAVID